MSTSNFHYAHWTRTQRSSGEVVWVESYEAAAHFSEKEALVADMQALRTMEFLAIKHGKEIPVSQNVLDYIKRQMIAVSEKIIKLNRKAERKGWYVVSDETMQHYHKRHAEVA